MSVFAKEEHDSKKPSTPRQDHSEKRRSDPRTESRELIQENPSAKPERAIPRIQHPPSHTNSPIQQPPSRRPLFPSHTNHHEQLTITPLAILTPKPFFQKGKIGNLEHESSQTQDTGKGAAGEDGGTAGTGSLDGRGAAAGGGGDGDRGRVRDGADRGGRRGSGGAVVVGGGAVFLELC